jgi:polyisoprenoid-binding protein YceI
MREEENHMKRWSGMGLLATVVLALTPVEAAAQPATFTVGRYSSATFKTDAPLETVVGTTAGGSVSGSVLVDPARPQLATGTIKVDLASVKTGIDKRDADMRSKEYLDTDNEAHRHAVFELKGVEIAGPLRPGATVPAKVNGILTIKGKPMPTTADAQVTYITLTPEQVESQKRFGFASENIRVKAKFTTSFTNHGMQVPQLLILKLSNEIQLETDLTLVRQ